MKNYLKVILLACSFTGVAQANDPCGDTWTAQYYAEMGTTEREFIRNRHRDTTFMREQNQADEPTKPLPRRTQNTYPFRLSFGARHYANTPSIDELIRQNPLPEEEQKQTRDERTRIEKEVKEALERDRERQAHNNYNKKPENIAWAEQHVRQKTRAIRTKKKELRKPRSRRKRTAPQTQSIDQGKRNWKDNLDKTATTLRNTKSPNAATQSLIDMLERLKSNSTL